MDTVRIPFELMRSEFRRILLDHAFTEKQADRCAEIFAVNSLEGVYSHGVYRFPRFIRHVRNGFVNPNAQPELVKALGSLEQWNGNLAPGPLNAEFSTGHAMEIAESYGLGAVALSNTNHWMRGGTYGWQAVEKGFAFIGWTNTEANMPAWGAKDYRLGNNPLVFAVPFKNEAIVLDFAMSQYSYGKMETKKLEGEKLSFPGGFNQNGALSTDPSEILESGRALPIGYWKGAGLSLLLDILAALLSGGLPTHQISRREVEYGVSQVYFAIDLNQLSNYPSIETTLLGIIDDLKQSVSDEYDTEVRYPGERVGDTRAENLKNGIPVNRKVWEEIKTL
ncbi:MAG: 3-dehydro-L-gulonate 2-dehydrogenase [Bacteroidota bacterium]